MRRILVALLPLAVASAGLFAQAVSRPNDPPTVTADGAQWFQLREPLVFAGNTYYPAGARIYFNGNTMTPVGLYAGVPLYVDTTVEPFSVILVPLAGRQMQPYERRRSGDLAGTVGSSAPSFPIDAAPSTAGRNPFSTLSNIPQIQGPPVLEAPLARNIPQVPNPETSPLVRDIPQAAPPTAPPASAPASAPAAPPVMTSPASAPALPVRGTSGAGPVVARIWITFEGGRWEPAGRAVPLDNARFTLVGQHAGFPVFRDREDASRRLLYVSSRVGGLVTPYRPVE
jgi:hypothetical protein